MKLMHMFSIGVATAGMTCLMGYASAANSAPGDLISDSMLVAQSTAAPGGKGGGSMGEMGRSDKGTMSSGRRLESGSTFPEKAKSGTGMDTGSEGNTGTNSGSTGTSSGSPGSSKGPTVGNGSSETSNSGSRPSTGTGGGGK